MRFIFITILFFLTSTATAEIRVIDESGLTRAIHHTSEPASIKLSVQSPETNNIHVKIVNVDGLAADIETTCYEKELIIPGVEQGSWQVSLQPKTAVITDVKIESDEHL